jgi:protein-L-isoaspartate(D-aspartate) O-methyltransferase|tara:strand:- start:5125 stop:5745 length:621 start_codon:yes stop_codon:yes gene_type:complete
MDLNVKHMIRNQLVRRDIADKKVLEAIEKVPRHLFVNKVQRPFAYDDNPLPIGHRQTISQPYIVAFMTEMLNVQSHHTVLEIGTGCGYQAAILSLLVKKVISLEIVKPLANSTKKRLKELNYQNIEVFCFNGKKGWINEAPYDRIITTAAPTQVPNALIEQLAPNGQMVIPVGPDVNHQYLNIITKDKRGFIQTKQSLPVRFVPMI